MKNNRNRNRNQQEFLQMGLFQQIGKFREKMDGFLYRYNLQNLIAKT